MTHDRAFVAGILGLDEDSALVWQVGVTPETSTEPPSPAELMRQTIEYAGKSFKPGSGASTVDESRTIYARTCVVPIAEVVPATATARVLWEWPTSVAVTLPTSSDDIQVLAGKIGVPDRDWSDEEIALWRQAWPAVLLESETWWIACYDLRQLP